MKLKTLLPSAFGKFRQDRPFTFSDGLNIIRGDNEAGKSTLESFILGMFYGFKKEGKTRISHSPEFERYRPWTGSGYRGTMTYEEGGRTYRVERSFDPDAVKVYDDATGEDVTRLFTQDSRKEYDFAQKHIGLSQKEFRNTVWIGQLGSPQEPGLGTEIQGKLQDIVQGGVEDVSLARALAAISGEGAKIKSQRSTKARLDVLAREIDALEKEMQSAKAREEQVREWLLEASDLNRERSVLQAGIDAGEKDLRSARLSMLRFVLDQVHDLREQSLSLSARLEATGWACDLLPACREGFEATGHEIAAARKRLAEIEGEVQALQVRREGAIAALKALSPSDSPGVDEVGVASLYSRYLVSKAQASRGERAANDARRELRAAEEEGRVKGYAQEDLDEDVLRRADDLQETCTLTGKAKDQLELEAEKARSKVAAVRPGGASTLAYTLALVSLGAAVICTVMGVPVSIPLFAAGVALFLFGVGKQRKAVLLYKEAQAALAAKEKELSLQAGRIEAAGKALADYLAKLGARSVEDLRAHARDIAAYRARLKAAKDRSDQMQKSWFDSSSEFSAIEKELLSLLRSAGALAAGEAITDAGIDSLRRRLREVAARRQACANLEERLSEVGKTLLEQKAAVEAAAEREGALLAAAGVSTSEELERKIQAKAENDEVSRALRDLSEREKALLSGRRVQDIQAELESLPGGAGAAAAGGAEARAVSDTDFQAKRRECDEMKSRLADMNVRLAGLEKGIRLKSEEGRPLSVVEEDLSRSKNVESDLEIEKAALDLAYETLDSLSAGIRREFAPALNKRVGEILSEVTGGRYGEIRVSPDLEMSVIHPSTGSQAPASALSGGTLDQCYFALRVAVAEAITRKDEFPFFLDDSFVQYDDRRLERALGILAALSANHQILVFSCHGREEEIAKRIGLPYSRVDL